MAIAGWEAMADWYDAKQGDNGDVWHRTLIDPALLEVIGDVEDLRVLDLGCGNGYISRKLARGGAQVTGIDASAPIIAHARRREGARPLGIEYHVADAARLGIFQGEAFDLVVANMSLMDIEDAGGTISEVSRVLAPMGRLVASLSHPCFDQGPTSGWLVEKVGLTTTVARKVGPYRDLFSAPIPWRIEGKEHATLGFHRPLSWYFRTLRGAGFVVSRLEEPAPTEEFVELEQPEGPWIAQSPLHAVIEAVKVGEGFLAPLGERL
ncbi:MAG: class I SAM-dependent methyltransferase [Thermoplasmata archaeon]